MSNKLVFIVAAAAISLFCVVGEATVCSTTEPAWSFSYPVDRSFVKGDSRWKYRLNGQSHGSLANTDSPGQHVGEDWNWGAGKADFGLPVLAVARGRVVEIWDDARWNHWGKCVLIEHEAPPGEYFIGGNGLRYHRAYSFYAHLEEILVGNSECVELGQAVGTVGDANGFYRPEEEGGSGGWPHLHFELRVPQHEDDRGLRGIDGRGPGYLEPRVEAGETLSGAVSPVEFIENNWSVGNRRFSVWVHPYEYNFHYTPVGNWDQRGEEFPEIGHGGHYYVRKEKLGQVSWQPSIPVSGYYKISKWLPADEAGLFTSGLGFEIHHHKEDDETATVVTRSELRRPNYSEHWVQLVDAENPLRSSFYLRAEADLHSEPARIVSSPLGDDGGLLPADTMRFTYVGTSPAEFFDVQSDHWAHRYVERLVADGAVGRSADMRFRPGDPISRAEFLKLVLVARYVFTPADPITEPPLDDVPADSWYARYVEFALKKGLDFQCAEGRLCPALAATRGWAAKLLTQIFPRASVWLQRIITLHSVRAEPRDSIAACRVGGAINGTVTEISDDVLRYDYELRRSDAAKAVAVAKYGEDAF